MCAIGLDTKGSTSGEDLVDALLSPGNNIASSCHNADADVNIRPSPSAAHITPTPLYTGFNRARVGNSGTFIHAPIRTTTTTTHLTCPTLLLTNFTTVRTLISFSKPWPPWSIWSLTNGTVRCLATRNCLLSVSTSMARPPRFKGDVAWRRGTSRAKIWALQ